MSGLSRLKPPFHVNILIKRLGISLLMLYVTRLIFLAFNSNAFHDLGIIDFLIAFFFDLVTVALFFLPYYTLYLLPIPYRNTRIYQLFFKVIFHVINSVLIGLNLMDVEYFKYTSKRSTYDLFSMVSTGNDFNQLFTTFLTDFWFLIIIYFVLILISDWLYRKTQVEITSPQNRFYLKNTAWMVILLPLFILIGRGGFGLKPVGIIEASTFTKPQNTAFVLPTGFTMIKTIDQTGLVPKEYFKNEGDKKYFNPIKKTNPQEILPDSTNVMIIMLESFGAEFIGACGNGKGYTPFLDSLLNESLSFKYGFANGKKSIEAVPAVLASVPTLMDNPYISSPYGDNTINTLPSILKKYGYESGFFHGATNGSMRFDGFASICGFDHYYGRFEYNNDEHFDKTWGILDEYFNPWTADKLTELKEPFFGMLFTLSSHHPYYIPEHMRDKVLKGPQKICESVNYGDYSLRRFFEEAKKQEWYNNTLFVILADHTPASSTSLYNQRTHLYRIPIAFYHPSGKLNNLKSDVIFQQLDIMPTILDLLNIDTEYYAYGNSYFSDQDREAISYLEGTYYYYRGDKMLIFSNDKARNLFDFTTNDVEPLDSILYFSNEIPIFENRIKSMIQRYDRDLINNQMTIK